MPYFAATGLAADVPAGVPLIGYNNIVTEANISALTSQTLFPVTNLANPATHLLWKGGVNSGDEVITIASTGPTVNYLAVAGHNFYSAGIIPTVENQAGTRLVSANTSNSPDTSLLTDDSPIIFRWSASGTHTSIKLRMRTVATQPQAAVIYAGTLLVLERSIAMGKGHVPINFGRRTAVVNGMSESGNFLGRIVTGEYRQSKAEFEWFTSAFYRASIDAFLIAAQEAPFFWAWAPTDYSTDVGYVWLTNNAEPEFDSATQRVALTLEMRGIA